MPKADRKASSKITVKTSALTVSDLQQNAILRHCKTTEAKRLLDSGRLVEMPARYGIYQADEEIREVYFPLDCVLSVVTRMIGGGEIEVGTVGREGTSGIPLIMGGTTTANDCYCQVPGSAIKIPTEHFKRLLRTNKAFGALLDRYLQAYLNFLGQLTGCNRLHSVYERSARWLLLSHDRVGRDEILLTHEYLAMMLGSRRSGVTIALSTLQRAGYIGAGHGAITILDRKGLEATTCECYAVARKQFSAFLSPSNGAVAN